MPMPITHSKRGFGPSGTVHMVKFVIDGVIESYCGATRQDIYGYAIDANKVTCSTCRRKAADKETEEEVHSGQ